MTVVYALIWSAVVLVWAAGLLICALICLAWSILGSPGGE